MIYKKMVRYCFICGVEQLKQDENRSFHVFPKSIEKRKLWLMAIGIEKAPEKATICSDHFKEEDFSDLQTSAVIRRQIKRTAVPSCYLKHEKGLKHIKDKRKYKGNSTKISKYVPPKTQANLQSNWYRYEDSDTTQNQDDETKDSDFSVLADAPITKGTHFQTKSDKLLANATESTAFDGLFTLNLEKLEESLMAIPFYKRIGIDEKYFSDSQIQDMNNDSEKRLKKFIKLDQSAILKSPIEQTSTDIEMKSNENIKSESNVATGSITILENLILEDHSTVESEISGKSKNSEDLEKWLDDFLNE